MSLSETNDLIIHLRHEEPHPPLDERDVDLNPFAQFTRWMEDALEAQLPEPNAMTLATATPDGQPSARIVLLRGFDERGFRFYTNYESRKGQDLLENPRAAILFHWAKLARQIRITGRVARLTQPESEAYFRSRPVGSQLGAWASRQSQVIAGREVLEQRLRELADQYADRDVPLPPFWGGYRLTPDDFEFWQSRPSRLHDRLRYRRDEDDGSPWRIERLSP
jgi:pyridoxamine 5'-phosphate oxidase